MYFVHYMLQIWQAGVADKYIQVITGFLKMLRIFPRKPFPETVFSYASSFLFYHELNLAKKTITITT